MKKSHQKPISLWHTVTSAEDTANQADLTVLAAGSVDNAMFLVNITRSDVDVKGDAVVTYDTATGILSIADGSTYVLTTGDIIHAMVSFLDKA